MPTFNLLYNMCLINNNPILYMNILYLKTYLNKFNGKKIININYLDLKFAETIIAKYFINDDIQFYFTHNSETNGWYELNPFINKMMPSVYSLKEDEYTFYGHTKSVTKYNDNSDFACLLWLSIMYNKNLSDFERIDQILKKYSCCGTLKVDRLLYPLNFVSWHYSGAFFWFKNSAIFSKNWINHYPSIFGMEGYLGMHINTEDAYAIEPSLRIGAENPYSRKTWEYILDDAILYNNSIKKISYGFDSYL